MINSREKKLVTVGVRDARTYKVLKLKTGLVLGGKDWCWKLGGAR